MTLAVKIMIEAIIFKWGIHNRYFCWILEHTRITACFHI
jgi:hypothetical protein